MHSIYRFISPSGKFYIGQSLHPEDRRKQHVRSYRRWLRNGRPDRSTVKLFCAFDKYPPENWTFEVLQRGLTKIEVDDLERQLIAEHSDGYNIAPGGAGGGMTGRKHSPETRAKMRAARMRPDLIEQSKVCWGQSRKAKPVSTETRIKMSEGQKNRTDDHIEKLAERNRGRPLSEEHRAKLRKQK